MSVFVIQSFWMANVCELKHHRFFFGLRRFALIKWYSERNFHLTSMGHFLSVSHFASCNFDHQWAIVISVLITLFVFHGQRNESQIIAQVLNSAQHYF